MEDMGGKTAARKQKTSHADDNTMDTKPPPRGAIIPQRLFPCPNSSRATKTLPGPPRNKYVYTGLPHRCCSFLMGGATRENNRILLTYLAGISCFEELVEAVLKCHKILQVDGGGHPPLLGQKRRQQRHRLMTHLVPSTRRRRCSTCT